MPEEDWLDRAAARMPAWGAAMLLIGEWGMLAIAAIIVIGEAR